MKRQAFTLIEILVTIAIIIVLAGITAVGIGKSRETARIVATNSFMNSITTALNGFERDHEFLPPSSISAAGSDMNGWRGAEILSQSLTSYLADSAGASLDGVKGLGAKRLQRRTWDYATSGRTVGAYIEVDDELIETRQNFNGVSPTSYDPRRFYYTTSVSRYETPLLYIRKGNGKLVTTTWDADENPARQLNNEAPLWDASSGTTNGQYLVADNAVSGSDDIFDDNPNVSNEVVPGDTKLRPGAVFEYWGATAAEGGPAKVTDSTGDTTRPTRRSFETNLRASEYMLISAGPNDQFGIAGYDGVIDGPNSGNDVEYDDIIVTGK